MDDSVVNPVDCVDARPGRVWVQLARNLHLCKRLHGGRVRALCGERGGGPVAGA